MYVFVLSNFFLKLIFSLANSNVSLSASNPIAPPIRGGAGSGAAANNSGRQRSVVSIASVNSLRSTESGYETSILLLLFAELHQQRAITVVLAGGFFQFQKATICEQSRQLDLPPRTGKGKAHWQVQKKL